MGDVQLQMFDVLAESNEFTAACYGPPSLDNMTTLRYQVWSNKMSNRHLKSAPELRTLPPTAEPFQEYVHRTHLETAIWKASCGADQSVLNPVHHRWGVGWGGPELGIQ